MYNPRDPEFLRAERKENEEWCEKQPSHVLISTMGQYGHGALWQAALTELQLRQLRSWGAQCPYCGMRA